ncbi:hypothetical protein HDZ31DRAFT_29494 [Schizophyllum fasciatum]
MSSVSTSSPKPQRSNAPSPSPRFVVRHTHLGAIVSRAAIAHYKHCSSSDVSVAARRTQIRRPVAHNLGHNPKRPAGTPRRRRRITPQQQMRLRDALTAASRFIQTKRGTRLSQLQHNVCEMLFSGVTPYEAPVHRAILALAVHREHAQVSNWLDNSREFRTKKGSVRLVTQASPWFGEFEVYPEHRRAMEDMPLERFVQLVEAERDRQVILLREGGFSRDHRALQEQAGLSPAQLKWLAVIQSLKCAAK